MQLHKLQKIGLLAMVIVSLVNVIFYMLGHFSPFGLIFFLPLSVLILIGYSINNSRKRR